MSTPRRDLSAPQTAPDTASGALAPSGPPPATEFPSVAPPASGFATQKREVSKLQARAIDAMYETLATLDHHQILSVRRNADSLEIRLAYESLLAAFHPRRFERTSLGEHATKLDAILARIHEAYAALSTATERATHDARFGKPSL